MPRAVLDPRVMAGREAVAPELAHDIAEERLELHIVVARDARIRRLADRVRMNETVDHIPSEDLRVIEGVERDPEHSRRAACVLTRLIGAAAPRRVGIAAGWHEAHPHADAVFATL